MFFAGKPTARVVQAKTRQRQTSLARHFAFTVIDIGHIKRQPLSAADQAFMTVVQDITAQLDGTLADQLTLLVV